MLNSIFSEISLFEDELKIDDDDFDDLQSLFMLFDLDKDGILNFKEYEKLLRCLGYRLNGMYYCRGMDKTKHVSYYMGFSIKWTSI